MVTNLKSIEVSLEKLSICPAQIVTIWIYGTVQQVGYLSLNNIYIIDILEKTTKSRPYYMTICDIIAN